MNYVYAGLVAIALLGLAYGKGRFDEYEVGAKQAASVRAQDLKIAKAMEPQLTHTLTVSKTLTKTLIQKVPTYVDRYVPAPGAASTARPAYALTFGAVWLWDQALSPGRAASAPATAPGAGLALSPITFTDAETNAIANFGQYRDCRTIVKGWQDWYRQVKAVRPQP